MVGFIHHDEDEESNLPSKLKTPLDLTWGDKFDFLDQFVPEDLPPHLNGSSLLEDFDSIKDWIEEMQEPEKETPSETAGPNLGGGDALETERTSGINHEEVVGVDDGGVCLKGGNEGLEDPSGEKLPSLNSGVEEGLGKVSLVDDVEFNPVDDVVVSEEALVEGDNGESTDSESEESESSSDDSSSSSSSSSSSGEEEDDGDDESEKKGVIKEGVCEVKEELEEGEIMEADADKMVSWSIEDEIFMDDDDEDVVVGPIMSKNEVKDLPPVLPVDVTLQPSHQMLPVGVVNSTLGAQVIVEGGEKHNPLSEGSILWITEKRSPLGRIDEIFGPVKNPYYIVRYNSESEVPEGLHEGSLVSFVPEFVDHVLNTKNLYQKGYDASGNNDEEVDEAEFSDDEQEAEYKRMLKMSKRGNKTNSMEPGSHKRSNNNNNFNRNDARSNSSFQTRDRPPVQANNNNMQNQRFEGPNRPPPERGVQPGPSRFSPGFTAGPGMRPGFPQQQGYQPNGMPFQTQNQEFAGGFQMPWAQQHHPMMNSRPPFQQGFNPAGLTPNNVPPFSGLPTGGGMVPPNAMNQVPLSMALQAQLAQLSMLSGLLLAGQGGGPPPSLPPQSGEAGGPPQFNQGAGAASHQGGPSQFNQGATPPSFNNPGAGSPHQGGPPQLKGATPPHQGGPPQFNNPGAALPHQGGPPQFNQGATPPHQEGSRPPFQHRGGGRSRGGRGRRGGGRRPYQSR